MVLGDDTGTIRLTLWDEQTQIADKVDEGDAIGVGGAYTVEDNQGNAELRLVDEAQVKMVDDDEVPEVESGGDGDTSEVDIREVRSENANYQVEGMVMDIYTSNPFYSICPECGETVRENDDGEYICEDHGDVDPDKTLAMSIVVDDGTLVGLITTDGIARVVPQLLHRSELSVRTAEHRYRVRPETAYELDDWKYESMAASDRHVSVGDRVEFSKTITEQDVRSFAAVSGDTNRLHLDDDYAGGTRFGRRIVHGTLVSNLISAALARLPGVTIYVSQDLSFLAPLDIGDTATAVCEIADDLGREKYLITTDVVDESGSVVIEGQGVVLIDDPPEEASIRMEVLPESG
jgi:acyl dehydratase